MKNFQKIAKLIITYRPFKMIKKPKLTPLEAKYLKLAEVYLSRYEDMSYRNIQIMLAKGVIVEMESDLAFFHLDRPRTEKSDAQIHRLNILRKVVGEFADIHSFNWQINRLLGDFHRENEGLKKEIEILKASIEELILKKDLEDGH